MNRQDLAAGDGHRLRGGDLGDLCAIMGLLDGAIEWLAANGRAGQWGTEPWSTQPHRVAAISSLIEAGEVVVAETGGCPASALVHSGTAPRYVPPPDGPESYVHLLVSDRQRAGRGAGSLLLEEAARQARQLGVVRQRVDCWAGGDRQLVRYYVSAGFTPTTRFDDHGWPGQVLERRLI